MVGYVWIGNGTVQEMVFGPRNLIPIQELATTIFLIVPSRLLAKLYAKRGDTN